MEFNNYLISTKPKKKNRSRFKFVLGRENIDFFFVLFMGMTWKWNFIYAMKSIFPYRVWLYWRETCLLSHLYAESKNKSYQYFMLPRPRLGRPRRATGESCEDETSEGRTQGTCFNQKIFWHATHQLVFFEVILENSDKSSTNTALCNLIKHH